MLFYLVKCGKMKAYKVKFLVSLKNLRTIYKKRVKTQSLFDHKITFARKVFKNEASGKGEFYVSIFLTIRPSEEIEVDGE